MAVGSPDHTLTVLLSWGRDQTHGGTVWPGYDEDPKQGEKKAPGHG